MTHDEAVKRLRDLLAADPVKPPRVIHAMPDRRKTSLDLKYLFKRTVLQFRSGK